MEISIFGLGYVGAVTAACLAQRGHNVIGVDPDTVKVDLINEGKAPIIEKDLEELICSNVISNRLKAVNHGKEAVLNTQISLICVGTPSELNGSLDLTYIKRVCHDIGVAIAEKKAYHLIVARSTMLPGSVEETVIPALENSSNKKEGVDFGVVFNPEFLREAEAVRDFNNPPKIVIGSRKPQDAESISKIYEGISAPLLKTDIRTAELVKYADNAFHALKITFANEIGAVCKNLGIDSHVLMDIFCKDTQLNIAPTYLKPGFAFGGSCLPKDLRALTYFGRHRDLDLPVLNSIISSNSAHIDRAFQLIQEKEKRKIGIIGFAVKDGTDDLRESPVVGLIEKLLGKGYEIQLYDRNVSLSLIRGANKKFITEKIPHIGLLIRDNPHEIIDFAEIVILGNQCDKLIKTYTKSMEGKYIIDLVRIQDNNFKKINYEGICW